MRLRYCVCGAPVVLVGGRRENDRPTGTEHVCGEFRHYLRSMAHTWGDVDTQALLDSKVTVRLANPEGA